MVKPILFSFSVITSLSPALLPQQIQFGLGG